MFFLTFIIIQLSSVFFSSVVYSQDNLTGNLTIDIRNIKNNKGLVKLSLYNSKEGFPTDPEKAIRKVALPIKDNLATVTFEKLPHGEYAVSLLHDENDNNKMDFHFYGMPKEGYGASNDAKVVFGPPDYKDAVFNLGSVEKTIAIKVKYW